MEGCAIGIEIARVYPCERAREMPDKKIKSDGTRERGGGGGGRERDEELDKENNRDNEMFHG